MVEITKSSVASGIGTASTELTTVFRYGNLALIRLSLSGLEVTAIRGLSGTDKAAPVQLPQTRSVAATEICQRSSPSRQESQQHLRQDIDIEMDRYSDYLFRPGLDVLHN